MEIPDTMRMRRLIRHGMAVALTLAAALGAAAAQEVRDIRDIARVEPRLRGPRPAYPVGEPVTMELILTNPSRKPVEVPEECLRPSSIHVTPERQSEPVRARKNRGPEGRILSPREVFRHTYDLRRHYKILRRPGHYWATWHCGSWKSPLQHIFVVEPYDPEHDKVARIETELGDLEMVLMPEQAPLHVATFVELARAGYYDGLSFNRLVPGLQVETGDRSATPGTEWDHQLPPEIDKKISPGRGLVGALRRESSMTSATRFFILLTSAPGFSGLHTFFGYIRGGQEVLNAFGSRPVYGDAGPSAFVMKEPVKIRKIEIFQE